MIKRTIYSIIMLVFFLTGYNSAQVHLQDSLALVVLYDSTDGSNWTDKTNWLSDSPVSEWYGISVDDGNVTKIDLQNNNLSGPVPIELSNISNLVELRLNNNLLTGSIPAELGTLSSLTDLWLYSNQLEDSIPSELGNLDSLKYLIISNNRFTGTIPARLGNLSNLESINLSSNRLTGNIPGELLNCSKLRVFTIAGNQLSGEIPEGIGNLTNLVSMYWSRNQLTGSIPLELGNLTKLTGITLYGNQLSGEIPDTLGNLSNLSNLSISRNQFTGEIPEGLGNLSKLTYLNLEYNQLEGGIPDTLWNLSNLTYFLLGSNQLTGTISNAIVNLSKLTYLSLSENHFTGQIPKDLGNISGLKYLFLHTNQFNGDVPSSIVNCSELLEFGIEKNQFVNLPDLSILANLNRLAIQDNRFTFEDIEPNIGVASQSFTYSTQDSIGMASDTTISEGANLELSVTVAGSANQYQWYRNGEVLDGADQSNLVLNDLKAEDSGSYICHISNSIATELVLYSRPTLINVEGSTAITTMDLTIPDKYALYHNYPNPFNPATNIRFDLPENSYVKMEIFDVLGRHVATLLDSQKPAGRHQVIFDASHLSSGLYFYAINTEKFSKIKKMLLVK